MISDVDYTLLLRHDPLRITQCVLSYVGVKNVPWTDMHLKYWKPPMTLLFKSFTIKVWFTSMVIYNILTTAELRTECQDLNLWDVHFKHKQDSQKTWMKLIHNSYCVTQMWSFTSLHFSLYTTHFYADPDLTADSKMCGKSKIYIRLELNKCSNRI